MTAPLESEKEGYETAEREDGADPVKRLPLLQVSHALVQRGLDGIMSGKPDGNGSDRNGTKRKVDVKAPTPGSVLCKGTAKEGTDDTCEGEDTAKATEENWTVLEAGYLADDSENRDENARGTNTLYGTAKDEDIDIRTEGTYETAELKDANCDEEEVFGFCDGEELAKDENGARLCD